MWMCPSVAPGFRPVASSIQVPVFVPLSPALPREGVGRFAALRPSDRSCRRPDLGPMGGRIAPGTPLPRENVPVGGPSSGRWDGGIAAGAPLLHEGVPPGGPGRSWPAGTTASPGWANCAGWKTTLQPFHSADYAMPIRLTRAAPQTQPAKCEWGSIQRPGWPGSSMKPKCW